MLLARTSFAALTTEFALQTRRVCRARAFRVRFRKPNARNARSRNLASASFYLLSKLPIQLVNETDGKGTVLKITCFFDSPASFRKLEIGPIKLI